MVTGIKVAGTFYVKYTLCSEKNTLILQRIETNQRRGYHNTKVTQ